MKINNKMHIRKKGPGAGKPRKNPLAYSVNSKDLFDSNKNPGLKLSSRSVLNNPHIRKTPLFYFGDMEKDTFIQKVSPYLTYDKMKRIIPLLDQADTLFAENRLRHSFPRGFFYACIAGGIQKIYAKPKHYVNDFSDFHIDGRIGFRIKDYTELKTIISRIADISKR